MSSSRLPTFFVIGAAKSGTSSLFRHLEEHPGVWVPPGKEIHYFDRPSHDREDLSWYCAHFDAAPDGLAIGDLTPNYLVRPWAAAEIASLVPDARLIALLRNPVDRAFSHYQMQQAKYPSRISFEDVVRAELEGRPIDRPHSPYLAEGRYAEQIARYLEHFGREQLLLLLTDDLERDPEMTFRSVCEHIGVDGSFVPSRLERRFNATRPVRSARLRRVMLRHHAYRRAPRLSRLLDQLNEKPGYPPLPPDLRAQLLQHFAADNATLADLLGRDLAGWAV